jgi:N-acetyl-anhydromuramyl-L-alanine amidase AmpD
MDVDWKDIDRWHRQRGWLGIGYHFVIRRNGSVEKGRDIDAIGAHARGYNKNSIGICLVGGVDEDGDPDDNFTYDQYRSLEVLCEKLIQKYPKAKIIGHNAVNPHKACPCFDWEAWLETLDFYPVEEV